MMTIFVRIIKLNKYKLNNYFLKQFVSFRLSFDTKAHTLNIEKKKRTPQMFNVDFNILSYFPVMRGENTLNVVPIFWILNSQ